MAWKLGSISNTNKKRDTVVWEIFEGDESLARKRFHVLQRKTSVVLVRESDRIVKVSSVDPLDVAVILDTLESPSESWRPVAADRDDIHSSQAVRLTASLSSSSSSSSFSSSSSSSTTARTTTTSFFVDRSIVRQKVETGRAPMVPHRRSPLQQWLLKLVMDCLFNRMTVRYFSAGPLRWRSLCDFPVQRFPAVRGYVGLTLDDAPCRFGRANSRIPQIQSLLREYDASATFMIVGSFLDADRDHEDDLVNLLRDGHELGNHGMFDRPCHRESAEEFGNTVDECSRRIRSLQAQAGLPERVRYFRAPHAKYTRRMESVLRGRGLVNVMCDTYASCPIVEDGEYIGNRLGRRARNGSIILLHVPERGFRDWCMVALRRLLEILRLRNLKVRSVGMLEKRAYGLDQDTDDRAPH